MATLEELTDRIRRAATSDASAASGQPAPVLTSSIKIDLKGEGFVHIDGTTVTNDDAPADCTVVVSREDLEAMAKGQLDPMSAMLRGRLKIKGDMAVAMQLQSLLRGRS